MIKPKDKWIAATVLIALSIPAMVAVGKAQPRRYYIPSGSMEPTLKVQSTIRVKQNPFAKIDDVQRGDVIVFTVKDKATGSQMQHLQRVIALPGDKVTVSGTMAGTMVKINGNKLPHLLLKRVGKVAIYRETNGKSSYQVQYGDNSPSLPGMIPPPDFSTLVPAGQLFCLGDNRDNSYDSRYIGSIPFASIVGKQVP